VKGIVDLRFTIYDWRFGLWDARFSMLVRRRRTSLTTVKIHSLNFQMFQSTGRGAKNDIQPTSFGLENEGFDGNIRAVVSLIESLGDWCLIGRLCRTYFGRSKGYSWEPKNALAEKISPRLCKA
jgi:hypothetical protein